MIWGKTSRIFENRTMENAPEHESSGAFYQTVVTL